MTYSEIFNGFNKHIHRIIKDGYTVYFDFPDERLENLLDEKVLCFKVRNNVVTVHI